MPSNKNTSNHKDHIHGILALAHLPNMTRLTREEFEEEITILRSTHGFPPEFKNHVEAYEYKGPEISSLDLSDTDLSDIDLRGIRLHQSNLSHTKLNSCKLNGAFLFGCDLSQVDSWNGHFNYASLRQCYITSSMFVHGNFEGTSFAHSNLENTKLVNAKFNRDTWFHQTWLYCTNFRDAYLDEVNLAEARTLFGVKLGGAQINGTILDYDLFKGKYR